MSFKNLFLLFGAAAIMFGMSSCDDEESVDDSSDSGSTENEIILNASAGTYELEVYTDGDYKVELLDDADWLTLSPGNAVNNIAVVGIKYDANDGFARMTSLAFYPNVNKTSYDKISIKQRAGTEPVLKFSSSQLTLSADGGEAETSITTNIPFEDMTVGIEYEDENVGEWIKEVSIKESEGSDRTFVVSFEQNESDSPRSATVTLTFVDGWGTVLIGQISLLQNNASGDAYTTISFAELRSKYSSGEEIADYVALEGIVVSNKDNGNAGQPLQTSKTAIDFTPAEKTIYFESTDGNYGVAISTETAEDNVLDQFDKATILLKGMKLTVKSNPSRYELSGFTSDMVLSQEAGTSAPVKERTISTLTDDDIYTYVKMKDVELPIRKGSLFPIDGGYSSPSGTYHCCTKYPLLVRDKEGGDMFLLTNECCTYHRDGTRLPYGSGNLYGVIVHEHFSRYEWASGLGEINDDQAEALNESYGNIGTYQLRHQVKDDIWGEMNDDFEDGFSALLCEYRYRVVKTVSTSYGTVIDVPSYGTNGWLTHTYQTYFTNDNSKNYTNVATGTHINVGATYFDYLGPVGRNASYMYGVNYGNKNGLGIILGDNEDHETYEPERFAQNDEGKWEFASPYATSQYCGYGTSGWSESYKETFNETYANVPNGGSTNSNVGKGHVQAGAHGNGLSVYWWEDGVPYAYLLNVSTKGISSTVLSMQLYLRATGNGFTPRYWVVEWAETDDQTDSNWTEAGKFTLPDQCTTTAHQLWQIPGYKPVNINLPTTLLGKDNVYIRVRPENDKCGYCSGDYDTQSMKDWNTYLTSRTGVDFSYIAIRYNK